MEYVAGKWQRKCKNEVRKCREIFCKMPEEKFEGMKMVGKIQSRK